MLPVVPLTSMYLNGAKNNNDWWPQGLCLLVASSKIVSSILTQVQFALGMKSLSPALCTALLIYFLLMAYTTMLNGW